MKTQAKNNFAELNKNFIKNFERQNISIKILFSKNFLLKNHKKTLLQYFKTSHKNCTNYQTNFLIKQKAFLVAKIFAQIAKKLVRVGIFYSNGHEMCADQLEWNEKECKRDERQTLCAPTKTRRRIIAKRKREPPPFAKVLHMALLRTRFQPCRAESWKYMQSQILQSKLKTRLFDK